MINKIKKLWNSPYFLALVFFLLLFLRRYDQLFHPYVWIEDGLYNVPQFMEEGWHSLFTPVGGYPIVLSKLISYISMEISFVYYPEISTYITWILTICIALLVVYTPTMLEYKKLAAMFIFLIPINAEPYGLPLYMLWFSSILTFLVALWQQGKLQVVKNSFVILAGLSSPTIVLLVPVQIYRILFFKSKKEEWITFFFAIIMSIFQLSFVFDPNDTGVRYHPQLNLEFLDIVVRKFFGDFFLSGFFVSEHYKIVGGYILLFIILYFFIKNPKDKIYQILLFMVLITIAFSTLRLDPMRVRPVVGGGARYFFLQYITLSWIILYIIKRDRLFRYLLIPVLIFSQIISMQHFCKLHDKISWKENVYKCANSNKQSYIMPIMYAGSLEGVWHVEYNPKLCKKMLKKDLFIKEE